MPDDETPAAPTEPDPPAETPTPETAAAPTEPDRPAKTPPSPKATKGAPAAAPPGRRSRVALLVRGLAVVAAVGAVVALLTRDGGPGGTAATVNGTEITRASFERELDALADNGKVDMGKGVRDEKTNEIIPELKAGWLTLRIYSALIDEEFESRSLKVADKDVKAARNLLVTNFGTAAAVEAFPDWFVDELLERNARSLVVRAAVVDVNLDEESIQRAYYRSHPDEFVKVCLSHFLVDTKEAADAALKRVKAGEKFGLVAAQVSNDPGSKEKGGDLGCANPSMYVPEFKAAALAAKLNVPTEPVRSQFGYHVLLVRERPENTFEANKEAVEAALQAQADKQFDEFLGGVATKAKITVNPRYGTLDFVGDVATPTVVPPQPEGGDPADPRPGAPPTQPVKPAPAPDLPGGAPQDE